ncbi:RhuM family protein [Nitrospira sp. Ecomares 2.1]
MPTKPKGRKTGSAQTPANASKRPGKDPGGNVVFYRSPDGMVRLEVQLAQDTGWLTQQQMAPLFQRERSVITKHINHVFKEGELTPKSNMQNLHIGGSDKPVRCFTLDVVISVGYRLKSKRGLQFRRWCAWPCAPSTMEAMHAH